MPLKLRSKTIRKGIDRLKARIGVDGLFREFGNDLPLRSDLFSLAQLEEHAEALAAWHEIDPNPAPDRLLLRLTDNQNILKQTYKLLLEAVQNDRHNVPAGEWLLDNYYLIEEQIRTARRHLPRQYSRDLPRLLNGPSAGYPCVYDLALELISHVDGRIDAESLRTFVAAYQRERPLKLGELWAVPIMMRQALIENLRRVAARIATGRIDRDAATLWAGRFIHCVETTPKDLVLCLADMARPNPVLSSAFVAELARRLSGQSPSLAFPLTWVEQRLSENGQTIEQMVQTEGHQQAVDQVSIGNSINSLRELEAIDWRDFVERLSVVEVALRQDPARVYARMDFNTRDQYRHVVEEVAKYSHLSEKEVAFQAIQLARRSELAHGHTNRKSHVGYYLVGKGLHDLEAACRMKGTLFSRVKRVASYFPLTNYLGSIGLISIAVAALVLNLSPAVGTNPYWFWFLAALLTLSGSHLGVGLVNWLTTMLIRPHRLPRMDFSAGIPDSDRAMVAIPTMLVSKESVKRLLEGLEVRYLANRDPNLRFCLLTDLRDAEQEVMPGDEELIAAAAAGIEELNWKYRGAVEPGMNGSESLTFSGSFFLFHRPRRWNEQEKIWMGYERKRGKLGDLNQLLLTGATEAFSVIVGDVKSLPKMKYVITLDTDTLLPRDAARQLIGTMAHPLNQALIDSRRNRVVEGYGILQPGVAISFEKTRPSWYLKLFGGEPGIDPYTQAISDVYQDVFGEGSFIGKGIYDIDAFSRTMDGRFPENRILSHDLLEGCYARSGLASDISVFESFPLKFETDVSRRHRWVRGDWQIAGWLIPGRDNPISLLSRWKILDNLRRSLVPLALTLVLVLGWLVHPHAQLWTVTVLGIIVIPSVCVSLVALVRKAAESPQASTLRPAVKSIGMSLARAALIFIFLPYDAFICADAIIRTIVRSLWTHRKMLEWKTASDAESELTDDLESSFRRMWFSPAFALVIALGLAVVQPVSLWVAFPILMLWAAAPYIAWKISQQIPRRSESLDEDQKLFLHQLTRKTWKFFETFVGPEDNWLPPDNFQEYPAPVVAHRTSPTNIGMSLLANLAAYDFGYISTGRLLERTGNTLRTMESLERFHGHFLNWYDTQSLTPLFPKYVSAVDSGNLAGHLLILRRGLKELISNRLISTGFLNSLAVTQRLIEVTSKEPVQGRVESKKNRAQEGGDGAQASLNGASAKGGSGMISSGPKPPDNLPTLESVLQLLRRGADAQTRPATLLETQQWLQQMQTASAAIVEWGHNRESEAVREILKDLNQQCRGVLDDLSSVALWLAHAAIPPEVHRSGSHEPASMSRELQEIVDRLNRIPSLREVCDFDHQLLPGIDRILSLEKTGPVLAPAERKWLEHLRELVLQSTHTACERVHQIEELSEQCAEFADIEYDFLYDSRRRLLAIGFNVSELRRDGSFYDLLASEARLASFVAIAQGRLSQENWFALGRSLTRSHGQLTLLSWSGSMFEYLMPLLVMPTYDDTLLDQTYQTVIDRQIQYGRQRGVPWGVSESGYNATDANMNYQYRAFGVPGLGYKRGLADDLVIAPYATAMALMVSPRKACINLEIMKAKGFEGAYGFHEAVDYTPSRLSRGQTHAVVQSYMAHHQGMAFLSFAYVLLNRPMQRRFDSDPEFQAADLLLQERIPHAAPLYPHANEAAAESLPSADSAALIRVFTTPNTPAPEVHLLSNGRYHVMVTNSGGGYSHWKGLTVNRWREDATRDNTGVFCYLRDVSSGEVWSTSHQPTLQPTKRYEAIFSQARAEFRRRDSQIKLHTEIAVSPEDDIEIRRTTIVNRSKVPRTIEFTSYAEVVLAAPNSEATHPAFSNLFVQTEILTSRQAILCTRRPRSSNENPPWMIHLLDVRGPAEGEPTYETDRLKFIGRNRTPANPQALERAANLTNSDGSVLDPIVAIRRRVTLAPDEATIVDLVIGMAESRETAMSLIDKYHDRHLADRIFDMAWTHGQVVLRQLNATEAAAQLYGRLASSIVFASNLRRANPLILAKNQRGQSGLWGHGISGDLPIVLLKISNAEKIELVRQLVQAHAYWRLKGLIVDLVIWNEDSSGYRQVLQDLIIGVISSGMGAHMMDRPGGIFVRRGEQMSDEDRILLQTVARAIIVDSEGALADQIERRARTDVKVAELVPTRPRRQEAPSFASPPRRDLLYFNGYGGFTADGHEYVIRVEANQSTPAPWVNVLANPHFGTVITESGGAYTWCVNAHEYRVTPWNNDPVSDSTGEAFYIRDEESGQYWSPTPQPARGSQPYLCRHGFGYSVYEYADNGIASELWVYVATDAPIKFAMLKIKNVSGRSRRLSATAYCEWVLGEMRSRTQMHVVTEIDPKCGALVARNPYSIEFSERIAFMDVSDPMRSVTGDRTEFLGRNGSVSKPDALSRMRLSGKVGAGFDPCGAMQVTFDLPDNREREIVFTLGVGRDIEDVRTLVQRFRGLEPAQQMLQSVWGFWNRALGAVHVQTPDPSLNLMANGWLLYQTLSARFWARSGYYQSGGAFGFRDQLQDVAALLHSEPRLIREHLLVCASRQFVEGDVQHWWHPPQGRGVRTHFSDDFLWLPLVTCRYVLGTGDTGVLDEIVPFIEGRPVNHDEEAYYDLPTHSAEAASLYEHCVRAIVNGLSFGVHGLPLIGCGDWNDGMNLVGEKGKGESVWLAFFLYEILVEFSQIARMRGDLNFADRCEVEAARLKENVEKNAWDGEWYRRAYFDNGEPLGSATNAECQIDSLPQSWSILSGAGDPERSRMGMEAVYRRLVRRESGLIQLFDPPFDKSALDPGYIKGYVPGVRENGGQYTHAAIWTVMAFAALGDHRRAWELFSMINPINHGTTPQQIAIYKVEPYVVAADVYAVSPHTGRGGWTWYTGSAGWMYRLITESLLGLRLEVDKLRLAPCLNVEWKSIVIHYRYRETFYHITVLQPEPSRNVKRVTVDGVDREDRLIPLQDDRQNHVVEVELG
ncbi:GH36-type glycosyl hydrolase domain-containing protein [Schlesneria sp. T3-172]|uniref:GH36-type glycosyl hydrolase domain-containing protein n=1 Tax=Schlesneria sphaerica TaxID=3373610 RepID=UPI0037C938E4